MTEEEEVKSHVRSDPRHPNIERLATKGMIYCNNYRIYNTVAVLKELPSFNCCIFCAVFLYCGQNGVGTLKLCYLRNPHALQ